MNNFWQKISKPIWVLAPMEGVTDTVFRQVMVKTGKPKVMISEFTGVEQLFSQGYLKVLENLEYSEEERPIVAQFWGITPELFYQAGQMALGLGFDGVDINMGCPDRAVMKLGGGCALVNNRQLARRLILATKQGVEGKIPVSVKTRLGVEINNIEEWSRWLLDTGIEVLTIHGRTAKEMSYAPANWGAMGEVVKARDKMGVNTLIIGNGNVNSMSEAREKVDKFGVDGVMIGRGVFDNPWLFSDEKELDHERKKRTELLLFHLTLWEKTWGEAKRFERLKRFFKIYLAGFNGAVDLRGKMMKTRNIKEAKAVLRENLSD